MGKTGVNVMAGTKVPCLRFDGFRDDWAEKKVHELFTVTRGNVLARFKVNEYPEGDFQYPVYSSQTLNDGLMGYYDEYLHEEAITWTTDGANAGTVRYRGHPFYGTNVNGILLSDEGFANPTVAEALNMIAWRHVSHVGNPKLMNNVMSEIKLTLPDLPEQQQIGQTFKTIDSLIQSEQQKLEQLQLLKKSFLQKMFPKKGATVPELRFDGFSGDWTEKKLGDVFERVSVKGRTDLPFITVTETETNVREDSHQGYGNDVSDTAKAKAKVILEGQFLIDLTSYSRGLYLCRMDGLTSNAYNVLDMSVGNEKFWSEYFITHNFVQSLKSITPPGARQGKMVEVDSLLEFDIMVPEQNEQQAIGQFFKTFDELIEKQKEKVENAETMKKALLQKMFV